MNDENLTRALIACGISRKAMGSTLAIESQELREHTKSNLLGEEYQGYFFYPKQVKGNSLSSVVDTKELVRAKFLLELFKKELILRGETVAEYPVFQAVKDYHDTGAGWDNEVALMAYGLGRNVVTSNRLSPDLSKAISATYVIVPDFYAIPSGGDSILFQSNFLQWIAFLAVRKGVKFILFSYFPIDHRQLVIDPSLRGHIDNNFIPMAV